jgi:hypothetical protein
MELSGLCGLKIEELEEEEYESFLEYALSNYYLAPVNFQFKQSRAPLPIPLLLLVKVSFLVKLGVSIIFCILSIIF